MSGWRDSRFKLSAALGGIGVLVLVALLVAAGVTQAQRGPDDLKAPEGDPGIDVLACFELITDIAPQPPRQARMVTDNFGGDVVNIFGSESPFFCESAVKTLISDTATLPYGKLGGHVFQCFDINRGASPDDDVSLITHNFGTEEVTVGQAVNMCETARKTAPDGDEMGWPGRMAMHCFSVQGESDHGPGNSDRGEYALTTENFGVSRVNLIATLFMCEEASKHDADPTTRDVGRPTGRVWQCIEAEEVGRDSPFNASISLMTTNFGEVEVVPDDLVLMCERARKVYSIQAFPVDRP